MSPRPVRRSPWRDEAPRHPVAAVPRASRARVRTATVVGPRLRGLAAPKRRPERLRAPLRRRGGGRPRRCRPRHPTRSGQPLGSGSVSLQEIGIRGGVFPQQARRTLDVGESVNRNVTVPTGRSRVRPDVATRPPALVMAASARSMVESRPRQRSWQEVQGRARYPFRITNAAAWRRLGSVPRIASARAGPSEPPRRGCTLLLMASTVPRAPAAAHSAADVVG